MCYKSIHQAKVNANKGYNPVIFRLPDGTYDWFPYGHPVPEGSYRVAYWNGVKWVNETENYEI